jgi:hypothetical protein
MQPQTCVVTHISRQRDTETHEMHRHIQYTQTPKKDNIHTQSTWETHTSERTNRHTYTNIQVHIHRHTKHTHERTRDTQSTHKRANTTRLVKNCGVQWAWSFALYFCARGAGHWLLSNPNPEKHLTVFEIRGRLVQLLSSNTTDLDLSHKLKVKRANTLRK